MDNKMDSIVFERMLSITPKTGFNIPQPCLRDLILDHFESLDKDRADAATKSYIAELWVVVGRSK